MSAKEETIERLKEKVEEEKDGTDEDLLQDLDDEPVEEAPVAEAEVEDEPEQRSSTREYVILCQRTGEKFWAIIDRKEASTPEAAIRSLGEDGLEDKAVYAAVPARNWNQLPPVSKETTTTISFK